MNKKVIIALMGMTAAAGFAGAADIDITSDITTSTTWTSDNEYNLVNQVYVRSGASLTIEAGTVIKSGGDGIEGGSLAVSRGGKIYVNGTKDNPVIMTSYDDPMTAWQEGANKWGNLTLMGRGLISASHYDGLVVNDGDQVNTKFPTGLNTKVMEGLTDDGVNDIVYGGADDNDDSGSIHYLSIRYGGKVIGLANELNGLSLGAIGRETDIDHVEIMNNVDDGIEIWGGTVNLKYLNIWNVGDDSFDVDEGWRGKAQFGLIVQGYSVPAGQGSGVGDNCLEIDGAEDSDAQPVTTAKIANFTVIGEPLHGDGATVWRDNARVQYHNCVFMDIGEELVRYDGDDGDGANGYGYNNTLDWDATWASSYDTYPTVNWATDVYATQAEMYPVQTSGNLAEMRGCLLYGYADDGTGDVDDLAFADNNTVTKGDKETTGSSVGAFNGTRNAPESNSALDNVVSDLDNLPIQSYAREVVTVTYGSDQTTVSMAVVTNIVPLAANDALTVETPEPADGFFTAAPFRGGFSANNNWLEGWTAVDAYGMTDTSMNTDDPAATIQMTASTFFSTEDGVVYTVEESSDMKNWTPVATVTGDGSIMSATDLDAFDSAKFYRAIIL